MKKTNRTFKRFAAITSASLLAACAVAPVFTSMTSYAEGEQAIDFTLSEPSLPTGAVIQETVSAYEVLKISKVANADGQYNVDGWGSAIDASALITALNANTTDFQIGNPAANAFAGVSYDDTKPADSAKAVGLIVANFTTDAQKEAFAKAVMNSLKDDAAAVTGEYSEGTVSFDDIKDGYYIMTCSAKVGTTGEYDSLSLGMLTIVDGTVETPSIGTGTAKVGLPEVIKKVKENSSIEAPAITINGKSFEADRTAEYNDVADYDIGDKVPFKLYGSLPVDLANYDTYYYKFTDTLGNEFGEASNYTVSVVNGDVSTPLANAVEITDADGTRTHTNYTYAVANGDNDFTITFNDVKNLLDENGNKITVNSDSIITVDYTAELLETAAIGLPGQRNSVNLTYSNNPNNSGVGNNENGVTPNDEVIVFTYEIDVTKKFKDAADNDITVSNDIKNAVKFELRTDKDDANTAIKFSEKKTGDDTEYYYTDEDGTITKLSLYDLTNSQFKIHGLDKGTYYLVETDWPDEYNQAGATTIEVKAVTNNAEEWDDGIAYSALTGWGTDEYGITTDEDKDSIAEATVINKKGTTLPGTGGIGTTIFYLGGGAMAAIGGIYLISKRRMKKSEE